MLSLSFGGTSVGGSQSCGLAPPSDFSKTNDISKAPENCLSNLGLLYNVSAKRQISNFPTTLKLVDFLRCVTLS